jgi:hypothetical protein
VATHAKNQRLQGLLDIRTLENSAILCSYTPRLLLNLGYTRCVQYVSIFIVRMSLSLFCPSPFIKVKQQNSGSLRPERDLKIMIDFILFYAAHLSVTGFWRQQYAYCHYHFCPSGFVHPSLYIKQFETPELIYTTRDIVFYVNQSTYSKSFGSCKSTDIIQSHVLITVINKYFSNRRV